MRQIIRAQDRHFSDFGWLKTYWLFSFSDYHDPKNLRFSTLRVFNDDVVAAGSGFPMHPHREMEIVTIVLEGELTHEDSMGNKGVVRAGEVQRMSAGTGVTHSERNAGKSPCHLHQIWIFPGRPGLEPSYEQRAFDPARWRDHVLPLASGRPDVDGIRLNADATIHRAALGAGREIGLGPLAEGRSLFVYVMAGEVGLDDDRLAAGDQARLAGERPPSLRAETDAELIMIDLPL